MFFLPGKNLFHESLFPIYLLIRASEEEFNPSVKEKLQR